MSGSYKLVLVIVGLIALIGGFAFSVWQNLTDLKTGLVLLAVFTEGCYLEYLIEEKK